MSYCPIPTSWQVSGGLIRRSQAGDHRPTPSIFATSSRELSESTCLASTAIARSASTRRARPCGLLALAGPEFRRGYGHRTGGSMPVPLLRRTCTSVSPPERDPNATYRG